MRRPLLGAGLAALTLAGILVLTVVAFPWQSIVRRLAERRLAAATGCAVAVDGAVGLRPGWIPEVRFASISFASRDGSPGFCHGELGELELSVRLWGLRIERLEARDGQLQLGRDGTRAIVGLERMELQLEEEPGALAGDLAIDIGDSHVTGRVSADLTAGRRPRLDVHLDAESLRLADLGIAPRGAEPAAAADAAAGWSDEPFDLAPLRSFDGTLVVRARDVRGAGGALLDEASFDGELERGRLSLRHVLVDVDGGRVTGELRIDARARPPEFSLEAEAHGVELARLLEAVEGSDAYSGVLHGQLALRGRGASPRQLVASLSGELALASPGGSVSTAHATLLTRDFFSVLRPSQRRKSEVLNCLVIDLGFAAGVGAVRWWVLDLEDLVVIGEGRIDLPARSLDLRFVPRPRDPSPLSTAATVRLTGPLSAPVVSTDKSSLVVSTGKALLETLPWLSRSRGALRRLVGRAEQFGRCREIAR